MKHPSEFTQIGADIEVQVLEIDKENRRLSLGHKQLEENPWDVFETVFTEKISREKVYAFACGLPIVGFVLLGTAG